MKKMFLLITAALLGVLVLAGGAAAYAYAQSDTPTPPTGQLPFGFGHGRGVGPGRGFDHGPEGVLRSYMTDALAEALGVSTDELQSQTPWQIAQEQGLSADELTALMEQARNAAIDAALADGVITQEQADLMRNRPVGPGPKGFGAKGAGPLQPYMEEAVASAFGLTTDELQAMKAEGQTLWDYAAEQGLTVADFQSKMESARNAAIDAALADGAISQEQADRLRNAPAGHGFGPGACDGSGRHGRPGGRPGFGPGEGFGQP